MSLAVVDVAAGRPYRVWIGGGALARLADEVAGRGALVLTDRNVEELHADRLGPLGEAPRLTLAPGEGSKTFEVLERVLDAMAAAQLGRDGLLIAFGGGVVGDVGGLAAALYMRGVQVLQCPTTLLAQVDSSVGGKTAVNLRAGKNLAGVFHTPSGVLADTQTLGTLPPEELSSGLGELVKTALISGEGLLAALEADAAALRAADAAALGRAVEPAVRTKAAVVAADEREAGPREVLNLGHTFGHAIEHVAGYGQIPHGVAVAAGLGLAARASERLGLLADAALPGRLRALLDALGLPAGLEELRASAGLALPANEIVSAARLDKKKAGGAYARLVLPVRAGEIRRGVEVSAAQLAELVP
ncbi:MAG: 3-dehydroquinate synthase family protein [Planctomycetota bacterium]